MALTLAFIGYNEEQTRRYFDEFCTINYDQIWFDGRRVHLGMVELLDGTQIYRVPSDRHKIVGLRPDQIVVACDRRGVGAWPEEQRDTLWHLIRWLASDKVSTERSLITYDLDWEEAGR